jgi:hypothetical protein
VDRDEANRRLWAQVEYFSGDEHIRREAEPWIDATPEERLIATFGLAAQSLYMLGLKSPEIQRLCEELDPLPEDSLAILARLAADGDG